MLTLFLFVLWLLYVGLTLFAFLQKTFSDPPTASRAPPWTPLSPLPDPTPPLPDTCQTSNDCPPSCVCLGGTCYPKLLRGGRCDPATGRWTPYRHRGALVATCTCHDDALVTSKLFGGDCFVHVACGAHGTYHRPSQACDCDPGYQAVGLTCQKVPVLSQPRTAPCQPDELPLAAGGPFHPDYLRRIPPTALCVKRPCSFDTFSGRPLKHARYEPGWGCVCDPRYGLFGVLLQGPNKRYLSEDHGYDACASLFTHDPAEPLNVALITYFYLGQREPVSLVRFSLPPAPPPLVPALQGSRSASWIVRQTLWRFDFAQHYLRHHQPVRARLRTTYVAAAYTVAFERDVNYYEMFQSRDCQHVGSPARHLLGKVDVYRMLYENPICHVRDGSDRADPLFWDRHVLNPAHFSYRRFPELPRHNAFVLRYDTGVGENRWTLDLSHEHDVDVFLSLETNAPDFTT